jgi:uncharacterized membrane protein YkoI
MISCTARTCFGFVGAFVLAAIATAQERQIQRSALPQAVERTLSLESQGAAIHGITVEKSNGKMYYEAELRVDGHSKDILMNADGLVVEVEEEVAMDSLPAAVNDELRARAKNGKVVKVEAISKKDKLVAYEAQIMMDGKTSEVQLRPDGKAMEHEQ